MDDRNWTYHAVALAPSLEEVFGSAQESFQTGRFEAAVAHCRDILAVDSSNVDALHLLGLALRKLGRIEEALAGFEQAVRLRPDLALLHVNLGAILQLLGRLSEAQAAFIEAIRIDPSLAEAYGNLGLIRLREGRHEDARRMLTKALALEPDRAIYWEYLAECEERAGEFRTAIRSRQRVLSLTPQPLARQHLALARALNQRNRLDESETHYRVAIAIEPDSAQNLIDLGIFLQQRGTFTEAEDTFRRAIRTRPNYGPAHAALASLLGGKLQDADLEHVLARLDDPSTSAPHRVELLFALGGWFDARADYSRAAAYFREANSLDLEQVGESNRFRTAQYEEFVDGLIQRFSPAFFESVAGAGLDTRQPVFIIGLPRSGTTLLEQVLASHSHVHGAGELMLGRCLFESLSPLLDPSLVPADCIPLLTQKAIRRLGNVYLLRLRALVNRDVDRIIDKLPDNYMYLGLLYTLFPNATIIHARRDLRDVALSCWTTNFSDVVWSSTPADIAVKFRNYRRLMDHWRTTLPATIIEVDYEETVSDLEGVARQAHLRDRPRLGTRLPGIPSRPAAGPYREPGSGQTTPLLPVGWPLEALRTRPG